SDSSVTGVTGRGRVQLRLPASGGPARTIQAETFDATGEAGKGLTSATFSSPECGVDAARTLCVVYREAADDNGRSSGTEAVGREARSRRLVVSLAGDVVTSAAFAGVVSFAEQGLTASAAEP